MIRHRRSAIGLGLCFAAVCAGFGFAAAQDASSSSASSSDPADVAPRTRALSGPEQIAEGEKIQTRGYQLSRRVSSMLEESRRENDIIRVTCLNEKLTQVNANLRTVEQRLAALRESVQTNDEGRRNHEYTVLSVIRQKFQTLELESNQCIGKEIYETGATRVITVIDPATPDQDPGNLPTAPSVVPVPVIPPPASPAL